MESKLVEDKVDGSAEALSHTAVLLVPALPVVARAWRGYAFPYGVVGSPAWLYEHFVLVALHWAAYINNTLFTVIIRALILGLCMYIHT